MKDIRRIVILGHSGFIGQHLMRAFRERAPDIELIGRSVPECDLTRQDDARALAPLVDATTALVMCAAIKRQFGDSRDSFSQNLAMIQNLCALLEERPVGRLMFFSSAAVYGEDIENRSITEDTPVHPTSYYGLLKYTGERLLWKVLDQRPQTRDALIVVRPALIYGPGDPAGTYGPSGFVRAAARGEPITLWGDGRERREFVFIDDVVEVVSRLVVHDSSGVVNVVAGTSVTFQDVLREVERLTGRALALGSRPRTKARVDHGFDNRRLRRLVPGAPFTGLAEGVRRTWEWETHRQDAQRAPVMAGQ